MWGNIANALKLLSLQWRHNEHDGVSNHQRHDCLLNRLFKRKTSKLRVTGLCDGNSPVTGDFPAQRASNTENVSIWWRHPCLAVTHRNVVWSHLHTASWIPLQDMFYIVMGNADSHHESFCDLISCRPRPWWRHQIETFSALQALCAGNSPVTGEFPSQRPVTRSFNVFFDLRLNKRLSKHSRGWWFEAPSTSL